MKNERMLVLLVLADVALALLTIVAEAFFQRFLPAGLQSYVRSAMLPPWSGADVVLFVFWVICLVLTVASWIALLTYRSHARALYCVAWGVWLLFLLASGPSVLSAAGAALTTLETLVAGVIIGLISFSDLRLRYERVAAGG